MAFAKLTDGYLPAIRAALEQNPHAFDSVDIKCYICLREIQSGSDISGGCFEQQGENREIAEACDDEQKCRSLVALSCGHMFGNICLQEWFRSKGASAHHDCPLCRQGSSIKQNNLAYEINSATDILQAPKCLSEGGSFPEYAFKEICEDLGEKVPRLLEPNNLFESWDDQSIQQTIDLYSSVVLLVQTSWNQTLVLSYDYLRVNQTERFSWDSRKCQVQDGVVTVPPENNPVGIKLVPAFRFPLFATRNGTGPVSQALRKSSDHAEANIWGPTIVGFGVGFCNSLRKASSGRRVATVITTGFEEKLTELLLNILGDSGVPEEPSSLLIES